MVNIIFQSECNARRIWVLDQYDVIKQLTRGNGITLSAYIKVDFFKELACLAHCHLSLCPLLRKKLKMDLNQRYVFFLTFYMKLS